MALDAPPDAAEPGGGHDYSQNGESGLGSDTLAEYDQLMATEQAVDDAAGFEATPAKPFAAKPPEPKPVEAPDAAPKVDAKADDAPPADAKPDDAAKPDEPADLEPPAIDVKTEAVRLRKGFAKLAQDREKLNARLQEAQSVTERAKALEAKAAEFDGLAAKVKADPLAFLEAHGIATDDLLQRVIDNEKPPAEREIERLRREIAEKEKAAADRLERERVAAEQARTERTVAEWARRNTEFAKSDPDKYDLINALDMGSAVHEACVAYYDLHRNSVTNASDAILTPAQAADYVEKTLRAGVKKSKFLQQQLAASQPAKAPAAPAQAAPSSNGNTAPKRTGSTTLTHVASGDSAPSAAGYPDDENEREAAVIREMRQSGELPDAWA